LRDGGQRRFQELDRLDQFPVEHLVVLRAVALDGIDEVDGEGGGDVPDEGLVETEITVAAAGVGEHGLTDADGIDDPPDGEVTGVDEDWTAVVT